MGAVAGAIEQVSLAPWLGNQTTAGGVTFFPRTLTPSKPDLCHVTAPSSSETAALVTNLIADENRQSFQYLIVKFG